MDHKKSFLRLLVGAIVLSAAIGIFIFLIGDFGETETKLLLTTLSVGVFSLAGLCCSSVYDRVNLQSFSKVGMVFSIVGFFLTFIAIWEFVDMDYMGKPLAIFLVLAITTAHISLLQLIIPRSDKVHLMMKSTLILISIVSLMIIAGLLLDFEIGNIYFRILGVFAILDVLGTIATPLVNRMSD